MRTKFLTFGSPKITSEEINEVSKTLRSGWLSSGPRVKKFEEMFKAYMHVDHAVALNSCTAALFLSLVVLDIKENDEVLTTPFTFAATANVILHRKAKPVFVDIDPLTMNIDTKQIEAKITRKTKVLLPVHFAGRPCDMETILRLARKYRLKVLQDAAHALETIYQGKRIGQLGDLTAFSFYATKNLTTGEGGMVTTGERKWAEMIQILGSQGMTRGAWRRYSDTGFKQYKIVVPGFKFNMMDMQAAIGIHQLKKIENYLKIREKIWEAYDQGLQNLPLSIPLSPEKGTRHARHLYTLLLDLKALKINRDQFQDELFKMKIGTGIHFISLHLHPYYRKTFNYKRNDFPNAAYVSERTLSLPLSPKLTAKDVDDVIWAIKKIVRKHKR